MHTLLFYQIHSVLVNASVWEQTLKSFSWRVDVRTKTRYLDELNQPSAIVELKLGPATTEQVHIDEILMQNYAAKTIMELSIATICCPLAVHVTYKQCIRTIIIMTSPDFPGIRGCSV